MAHCTGRLRRRPHVGDIPHQPAATGHAATTFRCLGRVRRRHALPTRDREPARRDVARAHPGGRGGQAVAAVEVEASGESAPSSDELGDAPLLGVAYGYCGAPDQWWQQQVVAGLERSGFPAPEISKLMTSYFELTELHIHPRAQGRGLGEALARRLLSERSEANVLLSTPETIGEANRAWRLYRRLGFLDIIRGYHFTGDPRAFAILGRQLPL